MAKVRIIRQFAKYRLKLGVEYFVHSPRFSIFAKSTNDMYRLICLVAPYLICDKLNGYSLHAINRCYLIQKLTVMKHRAVIACLTLAAVVAPLSAGVSADSSAVGGSPMAQRVGVPEATAGEGLLTLKASPEESDVFQIYGITGQLIKKLEVKAGDSAQLELRRGIYIVKCSRWARKIMVK